jgi:5'-nucleotidase
LFDHQLFHCRLIYHQLVDYRSSAGANSPVRIDGLAMTNQGAALSSNALIIDRILITNDDGIDAPGIAVLEAVAHTLAREVWVVAPESDQSGTSHSISLHSPLRLSPRGERRFAVNGTPGDCVVMAVRHLMLDGPPGLLLSGINRGGNLGAETVYSGTVGAAMTGLLLGIPSLALSQTFTGPQPVKWETARAVAPGVIRELLARRWDTESCLNINFPDVVAADAGPVTLSTQGRGLVKGIDVIERQDPRGLAYHWLTFRRDRTSDDPDPDSEANVVRSGRVSVTPLRFDRTHTVGLGELEDDRL